MSEQIQVDTAEDKTILVLCNHEKIKQSLSGSTDEFIRTQSFLASNIDVGRSVYNLKTMNNKKVHVSKTYHTVICNMIRMILDLKRKYILTKTFKEEIKLIVFLPNIFSSKDITSIILGNLKDVPSIFQIDIVNYEYRHHLSSDSTEKNILSFDIYNKLSNVHSIKQFVKCKKCNKWCISNQDEISNLYNQECQSTDNLICSTKNDIEPIDFTTIKIFLPIVVLNDEVVETSKNKIKSRSKHSEEINTVKDNVLVLGEKKKRDKKSQNINIAYLNQIKEKKEQEMTRKIRRLMIKEGRMEEEIVQEDFELRLENEYKINTGIDISSVNINSNVNVDNIKMVRIRMSEKSEMSNIKWNNLSNMDYYFVTGMYKNKVLLFEIEFDLDIIASNSIHLLDSKSNFCLFNKTYVNLSDNTCFICDYKNLISKNKMFKYFK